MTWLTIVLLLGGGRARALIVVVCCSLVSALLLVAGVVLLLPEQPREALMPVVAEPGTRGGFALAVGLLVLPPLLLLYQGVRLGTAAREQRLAGLRIAGATPADVRRLAAFEVGLPALVGAVLGGGLFLLLRVTLGGDPDAGTDFGTAYGTTGQLVPTSVAPPWWLFTAVVVGVGGLGGLVGLRVGAHLALSPHGLVRRHPRRRPRPWGLLLLVIGAVLLGTSWAVAAWDAVLTPVGVVLPVLGILGLAPWLVHVVGASALARTSRPATLLAAGRLVADPRPAGRAAAAVGGIGIVAGAAACFAGELLGNASANGYDLAYYLVPVGLIGVCLAVALLVVSATLAVHSTESLTDRRRSVAAQSAQGITVVELERSLRTEVALSAVPLGAVGAVAGVLGYAALVMALDTMPLTAWALGGLVVLLLPALTWIYVSVICRLLRPLVVRASDPQHLRTA